VSKIERRQSTSCIA